MNGQHSEREPKYSMIIEWSDEDDAFIVTVPELSGCMTHGRTYDEAVYNGQEAIDVWVGGAIKDGEPLPEPRKFVFRWWNDAGELVEEPELALTP